MHAQDSTPIRVFLPVSGSTAELSGSCSTTLPTAGRESVSDSAEEASVKEAASLEAGREAAEEEEAVFRLRLRLDAGAEDALRCTAPPPEEWETGLLLVSFFDVVLFPGVEFCGGFSDVEFCGAEDVFEEADVTLFVPGVPPAPPFAANAPAGKEKIRARTRKSAQIRLPSRFMKILRCHSPPDGSNTK